MDISASSAVAAPPTLSGNSSDNFSPVTVHLGDAVGAIFLGLTSIALFIALVRAEARNRALAAQWGHA